MHKQNDFPYVKFYIYIYAHKKIIKQKISGKCIQKVLAIRIPETGAKRRQM